MPEILAGAPGKGMRVRSLPSNSVEKRLFSKGNMLLWLRKHSRNRAITERSPGCVWDWGVDDAQRRKSEGLARPLKSA